MRLFSVKLASILLFILAANSQVAAQVETKIIDTGAGLATVTRFPDGGIMVYDTGHWNHDASTFRAFQEFIGESEIDLLIASHSDGDHIAATDELFNEYRVNRVIRTGYARTTDAWEEHNDAIVKAARRGLTHDINYAEVNLPHGTIYSFGEATVTVLSGFHEPPAAWGLRGSEFRNGNSVVVRVSYKGKAILFTGDAVGREEESSPDAPAIATERYLIDNNTGSRSIESDVMLVPHHGSDDAASKEFIRAVGARWAIFSAGHAHRHPKRVTAQRFTDLGYEPKCLLRTDLGDNEGGKEWSEGSTPGSDPVGDDSIEVTLPETGDVVVRYEGRATIDCAEVDMPEGTSAPTIVKKSRSGICHTPESRWYDKTKNFEKFQNVESCVASGGRRVR